MIVLAAILLILGGLFLLFPTLYVYLMIVTGGVPFVQVFAGGLSVVVGAILLAKRTAVTRMPT